VHATQVTGEWGKHVASEFFITRAATSSKAISKMTKLTEKALIGRKMVLSMKVTGLMILNKGLELKSKPMAPLIQAHLFRA
jgi:hypothetical protein